MKAITKKTLTGIFAAFAFAVLTVFSPVVSSANAADCATGVSGGITAGVDCGNSPGVPQTLFGSGSIFNDIVNVLLFIIGALSVIMLIYGGIRYTTSGGNASSVTAAKNTIMYAIIGLIVAFLAFAIVNWVLTGVFKVTTP